MERFTGLLGVVVILLIGLALSSERKRISVRVVLGGLALQFTLAALLLKVPWTVAAFNQLAAGVNRVIGFADEGIVFIFGDKLVNPSGPWGFVFAVKVLPVIIFFAALMGVLYHVGVMQRVVALVAWVLRKTLGVTGSEALSAAANIFVGQTEAPLCVKPYIAGMTRSQIMAVMVCGFSTIAGSVMAAYIGLLGGEDEASRIVFAKHLMTASVMSAPAGFVMAKLMIPETQTPREETVQSLKEERATRNILDAAAVGATDGMKLALNVAAMLIAFVALLALVNWPVKAVSGALTGTAWSLESLIGLVLRPMAWCMGVPRADCEFFGSLMGKQVIATEFVAYLDLASAVRERTVSERGAQIAAYALCGFANFPSIAIQIGGLSAIAPERRADFASLGLRAMTAGALACWMTASIAGLFIG